MPVQAPKRKASVQKKPKQVLNVQKGYELRPGYFCSFGGRALRDIIDPLGRVYEPHPYDIPQWRFRVLKFCAEFMLAMINTGQITHSTDALESREILNTDKEVYQLAELLKDVRNNASWKDRSMREEGSAKWDSSIQLLKVSMVRRLGEKVDTTKLFGMTRDCSAEQFREEKGRLMKKGYRLTAVVTVKQFGGENYDEVLTQWTLAFDVVSGGRADILMNELSGNGHYDVELYNLPASLSDSPEMVAKNQNPQFLGVLSR